MDKADNTNMSLQEAVMKNKGLLQSFDSSRIDEATEATEQLIKAVEAFVPTVMGSGDATVYDILVNTFGLTDKDIMTAAPTFWDDYQRWCSETRTTT